MKKPIRKIIRKKTFFGLGTFDAGQPYYKRTV